MIGSADGGRGGADEERGTTVPRSLPQHGNGDGAKGDQALPEAVDIAALLAPHPPRTNFNLFWVDDRYTFRVATVEGAFPWHFHPHSDEAWLVLAGAIRIRTELGDVELREGCATNIHPGLRHSPLALEPGTRVLIVNSREFTTVYTEADMDDAVANYREIDLEPGE